MTKKSSGQDDKLDLSGVLKKSKKRIAKDKRHQHIEVFDKVYVTLREGLTLLDISKRRGKTRLFIVKLE